jgi:hypothetical protein
MRAAQLLDELRTYGATITAKDDALEIDAPRGVLTPQMLEAVREHKAALLQVLAEPKKRPASTQRRIEADPQRLRLAKEIGGILQVLASAKRLKNSGWRINGQIYDHDEAVLLAAHTRGTTTSGYPLEFAASQQK